MGEVVQPRPALFLRKRRAEKSHLAHRGHDSAVETLMAKIVARAGAELCLAEPPCIVAHHTLVFRKLLLEEKRVGPIECGICHSQQCYTQPARNATTASL